MGWSKRRVKLLVALSLAVVGLAVQVTRLELRIRDARPRAHVRDEICTLVRERLERFADEVARANDSLSRSAALAELESEPEYSVCIPGDFPWELWDTCQDHGSDACLVRLAQDAAHRIEVPR